MSAVPNWTATRGILSSAVRAAGPTCTNLSRGSYSTGGASTAIQLIVPFSVNSSGHYTIGEQLLISVASARSLSVGGCPGKNVDYNPAYGTSSWAFCEDENYLMLSIQSQVIDLSDASWAVWQNTNSSYVRVDETAYWQNSTYCSNPPVWPAPTCFNDTSGYTTGSTTSYNAAGQSAFRWHGLTPLVLWTNSTNMTSSHKFELVTILKLNVFAYTAVGGLVGTWTANASGALDVAKPHHGARIDSIVFNWVLTS